VPVLASLPCRNQRSPALCGCKKHGMDLYGDHTSTCTAHSGATKAHDWAVGVLGALFRTAGHVVRTQHGVTASAGQRRGDVEVRSYLRDAAGSRSLVCDLSITHDRIGSSFHVQHNGSLSHKQDLDAPLRMGAQRKINSYRQQYADNQNISFLPAIMTTSSRMHGVFLRLLFLQAHRETTAHFHSTGLPSQQNRSDNAFWFKRAAFYMGHTCEQPCKRYCSNKHTHNRLPGSYFLQAHRDTEAQLMGRIVHTGLGSSFLVAHVLPRSKVGLASAKSAALRINLNVEGCGIVAAPVHAPSRAALLLPLLLSHNLPLPRVH
jgi:hypothetical protein